MTDAIRIPERSGDALLLGGSPVQPQADLNWAEQFLPSWAVNWASWSRISCSSGARPSKPACRAGSLPRAALPTWKPCSAHCQPEHLGGDVLQQLRPNLALSEATVSRWMSARWRPPALTVTGAADHGQRLAVLLLSAAHQAPGVVV